MNNHTPGPWRASRHYASEYGDTDFCSMAIHAAAGAYGGSLQIATVISDCIDGHDANARLIAAAPELLDALERLFNDYKALADSGDAGWWKLEDTDVVVAAMKAIAKARGES